MESATVARSPPRLRRVVGARDPLLHPAVRHGLRPLPRPVQRESDGGRGVRPDLHQAVVQDPSRVRVDAQDGELGDPAQRPDGGGAQLGARGAARDVSRAGAQPGRTEPAVQVTGELGQGTRYVSSSTAGAELGATTIGPLNGIAELTVLRIDPDSGRVLDYRLVQIRPDASAAVGLALDWPGERPEPVPDSRVQ